MKSLHFVGNSREDLRAFDSAVRYEAGVDLRRVQSGLEPRDWKPMKTIGAGVREIRIRDRAGAFRVFYVVESEEAVYVLHAFQKKTQTTAKRDVELGKTRYKQIK
jgi:phage-related protein